MPLSQPGHDAVERFSRRRPPRLDGDALAGSVPLRASTGQVNAAFVPSGHEEMCPLLAPWNAARAPRSVTWTRCTKPSGVAGGHRMPPRCWQGETRRSQAATRSTTPGSQQRLERCVDTVWPRNEPKASERKCSRRTCSFLIVCMPVPALKSRAGTHTPAPRRSGHTHAHLFK